MLCLIVIRFAVPSSGLYFTLNDTVYQPGDSILIGDIGESISPENAGSSLVCVTTNVNTQCCRGSDGRRAGEWYFPDGTMVPSDRNNRQANFTRSGFTHQVRLNRRNNAMLPTGTYECRVPHDATEMVNANITLILRGQGLFRNVYVTVCKENLWW